MKRALTIGGIAALGIGSSVAAGVYLFRGRVQSDPADCTMQTVDDSGVDQVDSLMQDTQQHRRQKSLPGSHLNFEQSADLDDGVDRLGQALSPRSSSHSSLTTTTHPSSAQPVSPSSAEFATNRNIANSHREDEGSVADTDNREPLAQSWPAGNSAAAPSPSPDSQHSGDSGKGPSPPTANGANSVKVEVPPAYEFEVPQDLVGMLIGSKGVCIKYLQNETGALVIIRPHPLSDKHKICYVEGTREQINHCLHLVRKKFPTSRFPELKLTPFIPPVLMNPGTPVFDLINQLSLPEGIRCEVLLSSFISPGHFFVQQPTHPTFPSLARLDDYMLAVYSQRGVPDLPRPMESGVICAAPVMNGWYRAQIMDVYESTDEVILKFVDYGGYSKVPASDLKQIRSDLMTLPFQAVECYLANVEPVDNILGWTDEAHALFEGLARGRVIEAQIVAMSPDGVPLVELYGDINGQHQKLHSLLIDGGYARLVVTTPPPGLPTPLTNKWKQAMLAKT